MFDGHNSLEWPTTHAAVTSVRRPPRLRCGRRPRPASRIAGHSGAGGDGATPLAEPVRAAGQCRHGPGWRREPSMRQLQRREGHPHREPRQAARGDQVA
jgi:hypothetical protein